MRCSHCWIIFSASRSSRTIATANSCWCDLVKRQRAAASRSSRGGRHELDRRSRGSSQEAVERWIVGFPDCGGAWRHYAQFGHRKGASAGAVWVGENVFLRSPDESRQCIAGTRLNTSLLL